MSAGELILYRSEDGRAEIQLRVEGETAWLTQAEMAELFDTTPQAITQHIRAIYEEGELSAEATCKDSLQVRQEGQRQVRRRLKAYNLSSDYRPGPANHDLLLSKLMNEEVWV